MAPVNQATGDAEALPDRGGSEEALRALADAYQRLHDLLADVERECDRRERRVW